jgi:hypothetical protein
LLKVSLLIQTLVYEFSVIPGKLAVASLTRNPGDSESTSTSFSQELEARQETLLRLYGSSGRHIVRKGHPLPSFASRLASSTPPMS